MDKEVVWREIPWKDLRFRWESPPKKALLARFVLWFRRLVWLAPRETAVRLEGPAVLTFFDSVKQQPPRSR